MPKRQNAGDEPRVKKAKVSTVQKFQDLINVTQYDFALKHFEKGQFSLSKLSFSNYIKQVLGKQEIRNPNFSIEFEKDNIANALECLARIYLNLKDYCASAGILQYAIKFAEKYKLDDKVAIFSARAACVENSFLTNIGIEPNSERNSAKDTEIYKKELEEIRKGIEREVVDGFISDFASTAYERRIGVVEEIYKKCSDFFIKKDNTGFIQRLINQCISQLGDPPCKFALVALGSISVGKITPYSDLESLILIEKDTEKNKEYFRNLTKLLNIKLINLGETPLHRINTEISKYYEVEGILTQWFSDELTKKGFGPDCHSPTGSKTPLGRMGYKFKDDYELIQTVEGILKFQNSYWLNSDPKLVYGLFHTVLITGDQSLLDNYRNGLYKIDYKFAEKRVLTILAYDIQKLELKLGIIENGKLYNVKQDLYRGVDILINHLLDYYQIMPKEGEAGLTTWQLIDKMLENGKLSNEGANHLKEAVSIISLIRLKTYSRYKCQKEDLQLHSRYNDNLEEVSEQEDSFIFANKSDREMVKRYYYIMLRLQKVLSDFLKQKEDNPNKKLDLTNEVFFDDSDYIKSQVCLRLLDFENAIKYMDKVKGEFLGDKDFLLTMQSIYKLLGNEFEADVIGRAIHTLDDVRGNKNSIYNIGERNSDNSLIEIIHKNRAQDCKYFKLIFQKILDQIIPISDSLLSAQEKEAESILINQINIFLSSKSKMDYKKIIESSTKLGSLYFSNKLLKNAEVIIKFSLQLQENYYLGKENLNMLENFYILSRIYFNMSKYEESEEYFMKTLEFSAESKCSHPVIESANELFKEFYLKHNSFVSGSLEHYYLVKFEQFQLTQLKIFLPLLVKAIEGGAIKDTIKIISDYDYIIYLYAMFCEKQSENNELYSTEACNILLQQVPGEWLSPLGIAIYSSEDDMVAFWKKKVLCTQEEVEQTCLHGKVVYGDVLSEEELSEEELSEEHPFFCDETLDEAEVNLGGEVNE